MSRVDRELRTLAAGNPPVQLQASVADRRPGFRGCECLRLEQRLQSFFNLELWKCNKGAFHYPIDATAKTSHHEPLVVGGGKIFACRKAYGTIHAASDALDAQED